MCTESAGRPRGSGLTRRTLTLALLGIAVLSSSCAYFNTFYVARKYYFKATSGAPYRFESTDSPDIANFNKSIDYSKKLLASYPKSKWVDDAYLLWARGYLGKNDPLQTVTMLQDFTTRYPNSPLAGEANFYRAVALRQARRYGESLTAFNDFIKRNPKNDLLPYAYLESSRALMSLGRPEEAAKAAGEVVRRWPKGPLATTAREARAEALFAQGEFDGARADYHQLGLRSRDDDQRLDYLLRESECLEGAHKYDESIAMLRGALFHEQPPQIPDTTGGRPRMVQQTPGYDRYGRLLTRIGTVELMSGRVNDAIESYQRVVDAYPKAPMAAEAQYRLGYAYEIGADDFDKARAAYAKVKDQSPTSPFATQAQQRQSTLDQIARFRTAGGDSVEKKAEASFLLAEQYLFQLNKPERALDVYQTAEQQNVGNAWGAKAINAQAWVLMRKLNRTSAAESLLWRVVHDYPATEAQLAARDYLEGLGQTVPSDLIKMPEPHYTHADSLRADSLARVDSIRVAMTRPLTPPPATVPPIGMHPPSSNPDSIGRLGPPGAMGYGSAPGGPIPPGTLPPVVPQPSMGHLPPVSPAAGAAAAGAGVAGAAATGAGSAGLGAAGAGVAGTAASGAGAAGAGVTGAAATGVGVAGAGVAGAGAGGTGAAAPIAAGAAGMAGAGIVAADTTRAHSPAAAPADTLHGQVAASAAADTLRIRRDDGFRPRGFKIQ